MDTEFHSDDAKCTSKTMVFDLDRVCRYFGEGVLKDWGSALTTDVFVDTGRGKVIFQWLVREEEK